MQTNFTPEQLADPRIAEAESILRRCVHCGFCTATCSTYVLLGDERDSPRGRIYLIKEMFETGEDASREVTTHVDRCLTCLSCMTTCPSGVDYLHLSDLARAHIHETGRRGLMDRMTRGLLARVLPYPSRFRAALWAAMLGRPLAPLFRAVGLKPMAAMLALAPRFGPARGGIVAPGVYPPDGERTRRVALLTGCAQQAIAPQINAATIRLLNRHGVEVVVPEQQGCCGALVHHMGHEDDSREQARRNVDAWSAAERDGGLDAILINASGCGTMVKDYGHLFARDEGYRERAAALASKTRDITEFLAEIGLKPSENWTGLTVAYHSACSMQHGQRIHTEPRALLRQAGYTVAEVPEGHICCGSAGTYNITQPEIAADLRERKLKNIRSVRPDVVAAGNVGCITQLQGARDLPVVHTVELLDWALGGPCPKPLTHLAGRVRRVRDLIDETVSAAANEKTNH
ncbi:MAG: glycolate oxidase subunit GlcF [Hyphomicrobiales bacterium]